MGFVDSRVGWAWLLVALLAASPALAEELPVAAASNTEEAPAEARNLAAPDESEAVGFISVAVQGATADPIEITVNGSPMPRDQLGVPLKVAPGEHVFQARAGDLTSSSMHVLMPPGGVATVILTLVSPGLTANAARENGSPLLAAPVLAALPLPAQDRSLGERPYLIGALTALSVGVVGLSVGSYFALSDNRSAAADRLYGECAPRVCTSGERRRILEQDESATARGKALAIGGFVGGGLGLATAGALFVVDRTQRPARRVTPLVGANYVGLAGSF